MKYAAIFILIFIGLWTLTKIISQEPIITAVSLKKRKVINRSAMLVPFIKLKEGFKASLQEKLSKTGDSMTPEEFVAQGAIRPIILVMLGTFMILNRNYALSGYIIILAVYLYHRDLKKLDNEVEDSRDEILDELPEFMSYMTNSLKTDKDIKKILDSYKGVASRSLENEIQKLRADLQTGNADLALHEFDLRINNTHLSNYVGVVRATLNGETQYSALESITQDMEKYEFEIAKRKAKEIPGKIKRASFAVSVSSIISLLIVMLYALKIGMNNF